MKINMSMIFNIIIIIVCICHNVGGGKNVNKKTPATQKPKLPFPHLIKFNEADIEKPYHIFDGVDYEQLPKEIYDKDIKYCYDELTRCTRFTVYENPVCGYSVYDGLRAYYSLCHLDLESCLVQPVYYKGIDMHGTTYRQRAVFFVGEGNDCEIFVRRFAEGEIPRDLRDPPEDFYKPNITAKDLEQDETINNNKITNIEYDDVIY